jgi:hypothetical protein
MWFWGHRVDRVYYTCLGVSMFVMIVMNPILFMRLLRSDYLRGSSRGSKGKGATGSEGKGHVVNGNNNHLTANGTQTHLKAS